MKRLAVGIFMCAVMIALVPGVSSGQAGKTYDLLLKGGRVLDPANNIDGLMDVAVKDGRIAKVAKGIPAADAETVADVTGLLVTPGLIDIHAHVYFTFFTSEARSVIPDDLCLPSGVTTVVDAGTSGADTFEDFMAQIGKGRANTKVRVFAFINISDLGMTAAGEQNPAHFNVRKAVEMAKKHPDVIVGFKTAHYWTNAKYDAIHTPWATVDSLLAAGREANLPVMVDFFPRPAEGDYPARSYRELLLDKLRPGDIHTHVFARHIPVIREDGALNPDLIAAQKRGVILDVGHGAGSFVYRNAVPAIKQGFLPNSISTDLHGMNVPGPVVNQLNVMSKFLAMGVPLNEVIRRATVNPAAEIRHPELGTLSVGSAADIAVLTYSKALYGYTDTSAGMLRGNGKLTCAMTILSGNVLFDPAGRSKVEWTKIPKDSQYWRNPSAQQW